MIAEVLTDTRKHGIAGKTLVRYALQANIRMSDALWGVEFPQETPTRTPLGFWDSVPALVGSLTSMSGSTSPKASPCGLYQAYTAALSKMLYGWDQQTDDLLASLVALANRVGIAQTFLESISGSGKARPVQRQSWRRIFLALKNPEDYSFMRKPMEALSRSLEGLVKKYSKGGAKIRNIKDKIDTLSRVLAGPDAGLEDEADLELWRGEIQKVIHKLNP